jgi:hypothetical protein
MHMQKWMRTGALAVGLTGALIGGGTMVAHAQTSDTSGSSSSSTTSGSGSSSTTNGSSSTTAPSASSGTAGSGAAQGNCPNM